MLRGEDCTPPLNPYQFKLLLETLRTHPEYRVKVALRNLDGDRTSERVLRRVIDGQVDQAGPGRTASVVIGDPDRKLKKIEGVRARQHMLRIWYEVYVPNQAVAGWVSIPLFTGCCNTVQRDGALVTITAGGNARFSDHTLGETFTVKKGVKRTEAIIRALVACGEVRRNIEIVDRPAKLAHDFVITPLQHPWRRCVDLASSLDLHLAYNGAGILRGRPEQTTPVFTMRTAWRGRPGWLTSQPVIERNFRDIVNEIWLRIGPATRGPVRVMSEPVVKVRLPAKHPNSAESLKRNGVPQRHIDYQEQLSIHKHETAVRIAKARLEAFNRDVKKVRTECFPFPLLEAGDLLQIGSHDFSGVVRPDWTLPFTPGEMMTLGWTDARSLGPV